MSKWCAETTFIFQRLLFLLTHNTEHMKLAGAKHYSIMLICQIGIVLVDHLVIQYTITFVNVDRHDKLLLFVGCCQCSHYDSQVCRQLTLAPFHPYVLFSFFFHLCSLRWTFVFGTLFRLGSDWFQGYCFTSSGYYLLLSQTGYTRRWLKCLFASEV